ncbi:polyprenyl synthetase family protein [Nocardioides jishulii]|uniref:Polyprenyl synthetase family protein n=1 Tax=Nocardioides jishulii TaxID=2575440 RepID=A0A4U2YN37_9ACTN|nr:polyprenyl synthetase family protein [Nocardioides jishulii]QCX27880.1 polyprenyl synthetase family protein [Nocardioides jishulii]TKI62687.1 polyprenyl synthetase family protein [Nocardioides jishulii]
MTLQAQIDTLVTPTPGLGGLPLDRSMLGIALRMGTEGGKRFRPWLFAATYDQLSGRWADAPAVDRTVRERVAAAIELLHTAFVIHDDVIDNDDERRGHTSIPGWFRGSTTSDSAVYARAGAILTGDLALAAAVRGIATCGAPQEVTTALLDLLDSTLHDSAVGELSDVRLAIGGAAPTMDDAIAVAELKTAAYSFVLPMKAAAILAGAPEDVLEKVSDVGRSLGIAFQLRDDLLGTFGDPAIVGKDPDGDLREGKRTPLVVHAAASSHWWRVEPHLGNPDLTREEADEIRRALMEAGSFDHVETLMGRHVRIARWHAEALDLTAPIVDTLTSTWDIAGATVPPAPADEPLEAATVGVA